uniref:Putative transport permease ycf38 n=2 Tax=Grateloupia TaxID=31454 RepID=A0A6F8Z1Q8_9FLOR|nr:putative transport permease ycf38 [Grateloupia filicina]AWD77309.1 putative transport permease ycf38 [Grateloupia filicina]BCB92357.1 putative transport permease ycf38 [Grateloupia asiatica]
MINTLQQSPLKYSMKLEPRKIIRIKGDKKNLLCETYALTKRLYIQLIRRPSTLVSGIIQPLLWLILFGALFQNAPVELVTSNIRYGKFLSPGIIVFTAFTGSINAGLPLMFDREFGFLNRLLTAPLSSRDSLLISSMIFIATTTIMQTFVIIIFTLILFKSIMNLYNIYIILTITLLIALSIGSISLYLAFILPGHIEFLAFILIINLPTLFSSTALAPLSFMPYWLQIIASINPLTYAIESIRYISLNNSNSMIQTVWRNLEINECMYLLIFINIISFLVVKNLISYKFE